MKTKMRGSFTAEATIVVTFIIIVLVLLIQSYLNQFIFQYARTAEGLRDHEDAQCKHGLYFDSYVKAQKLTCLGEREENVESYEESLNYLRLMHSYILLDELGEVAWDGVEKFKE